MTLQEALQKIQDRMHPGWVLEVTLETDGFTADLNDAEYGVPHSGDYAETLEGALVSLAENIYDSSRG